MLLEPFYFFLPDFFFLATKTTPPEEVISVGDLGDTAAATLGASFSASGRRDLALGRFFAICRSRLRVFAMSCLIGRPSASLS